jgi:site-specific DNA-methyltransferase (adenine-specific)
MMNIKEEFKNLIPALSVEEFKQLEENCLAEGIRDAIITWHGYIIDGHNRYKIATKHELQYESIEKSFDSEDDVKEWMIHNQFGRRNLSNYQRSVLALELESVFSARAKERMLSGNPVPKSEQGRTIEKVADVAKVGKDTIAKVKVIQATATPEVKAKLNAGTMSINEAYKINHFSQVASKIKDNDIKTQAEINVIVAKEFNVNMYDVYLINDKHKLIVADSFLDIDFIKKESGPIDCILTDPPYGISYKSPSGNGSTQRGDYKIIDGDNEIFNPDILLKYSNNIITWGANHYANKLENSAGWLVWDKRDGVAINLNSDCEMAWSNMIKSARLFHHTWNGMIKASEKGDKRIHPTQKPIKLFEWCLDIVKAGQVVIDIFAGSGIIIPACQNTNRVAIAIEKDFTYAAAILNRLDSMGYKIKKQ